MTYCRHPIHEDLPRPPFFFFSRICVCGMFACMYICMCGVCACTKKPNWEYSWIFYNSSTVPFEVGTINQIQSFPTNLVTLASLLRDPLFLPSRARITHRLPCPLAFLCHSLSVSACLLVAVIKYSELKQLKQQSFLWLIIPGYTWHYKKV